MRGLIAVATSQQNDHVKIILKPCWSSCQVGKSFSGIYLEGDLAASGGDFEALENLRKLAFTEQVDPPKQLELWLEPQGSSV